MPNNQVLRGLWFPRAHASSLKRLLVAAGALVASLATAQTGSWPPSFTTRAPKFNVVQIAKVDSAWAALIRNDYDREIVAWVVTSRRPSGLEISATQTRPLAPGDTTIYSLDPESFRRNPQTLEMSCVVFRDRSGVGEPKLIRAVNDEREGRFHEIARQTPLLNTVLSLQPSEVPGAIALAIRLLQQSPALVADSLHSETYVQAAMRTRWEIVRRLQELQGPTGVLKPFPTANLLRAYVNSLRPEGGT